MPKTIPFVVQTTFLLKFGPNEPLFLINFGVKMAKTLKIPQFGKTRKSCLFLEIYDKFFKKIHYFPSKVQKGAVLDRKHKTESQWPKFINVNAVKNLRDSIINTLKDSKVPLYTKLK